MRSPAVLFSAFILLAGTSYFIARTKENAAVVGMEARLEISAAQMADAEADRADAELIRNGIQNPKPSDSESAALVEAAGRRYMRRKIAYNAAKETVDAGKAPAATLEPLLQDLEAARRVCDRAESHGHPVDTLTLQAELEMERRLAFSVGGLVEHHDGRLTFSDADLKQLEKEFQSTFHRSLPVSARGETAVHRAMGFDHRGRTDVAVTPETTEGVWVRNYLTAKGVSFFAFRSAVRGKATGAHIHIGPASGKHVPGA